MATKTKVESQELLTVFLTVLTMRELSELAWCVGLVCGWGVYIICKAQAGYNFWRIIRSKRAVNC